MPQLRPSILGVSQNNDTKKDVNSSLDHTNLLASIDVDRSRGTAGIQKSSAIFSTIELRNVESESVPV